MGTMSHAVTTPSGEIKHVLCDSTESRLLGSCSWLPWNPPHEPLPSADGAVRSLTSTESREGSQLTAEPRGALGTPTQYSTVKEFS